VFAKENRTLCKRCFIFKRPQVLLLIGTSDKERRVFDSKETLKRELTSVKKDLYKSKETLKRDTLKRNLMKYREFPTHESKETLKRELTRDMSLENQNKSKETLKRDVLLNQSSASMQELSAACCSVLQRAAACCSVI